MMKTFYFTNRKTQSLRRFSVPKNQWASRFNPQWEEKFNWLCYSPSVDVCFCTCCLVFAPESTRNMELISMPFRDWKNAVGSQRGTLPKHVNSDIHRDALTKAEQFLASCDNKRLSVASQVSAAYSESVERNRAIYYQLSMLLPAWQSAEYHSGETETRWSNEKMEILTTLFNGRAYSS